MRVFVTGASGFIGGVLCGEVPREGHHVGALGGRPGSEPAGTRAAVGDLGDGARLGEILARERPRCVIHLAAEIASQRSESKVREVNVEGTRRLLDACLSLAGDDPAAGPRVVFSSTVVTGEAAGALLTEKGPLPVQTPYGRSKQECERMLLDSGLPVVVLRGLRPGPGIPVCPPARRPRPGA